MTNWGSTQLAVGKAMVLVWLLVAGNNVTSVSSGNSQMADFKNNRIAGAILKITEFYS
ncbi:hypothetical protein HSBAA_48060 [Vreelandella sulfidaeris]|uniref:Uncharacterized protein n=2 Tax=Vreelandella TaxID=3137766 RepID=A0A455UB99_9GAMM|nr:hypothetical protein HSBAA_48060 [Halomonas sulfidaeris]